MQLKTTVKGIEEEYNEYVKIMEKQKNTIEHQLAIIKQQREHNDGKDKVIKDKDQKLNNLAQKIGNFRESLTVSKKDYVNFLKELYDEYGSGKDCDVNKSPEILDEFDRQIKALHEAKASQDKISEMKEVRLEKMCKNLRLENSKLITDLNGALLQIKNANSELHTLRRDASGSILSRRDRNDPSRLSLSIKISNTRDQSLTLPNEGSPIPPIMPLSTTHGILILLCLTIKQHDMEKSIEVKYISTIKQSSLITIKLQILLYPLYQI
jgi:YD repeat-containing protein